MVLLWYSYGIGIILYGIGMVAPWNRYGIGIALERHWYNFFSILLVWYCGSIGIGMEWYCYVGGLVLE